MEEGVIGRGGIGIISYYTYGVGGKPLRKPNPIRHQPLRRTCFWWVEIPSLGRIVPSLGKIFPPGGLDT